MNISIPQSYAAISEVKELMSTNDMFISSQHSKPILTAKQDIMTGWYIITKNVMVISKDIFMDAISIFDFIQCQLLGL